MRGHQRPHWFGTQGLVPAGQVLSPEQYGMPGPTHSATAAQRLSPSLITEQSYVWSGAENKAETQERELSHQNLDSGGFLARFLLLSTKIVY